MRRRTLLAAAACLALWTVVSGAAGDWDAAAADAADAAAEQADPPPIPGAGQFIPPPSLDSEQARFLRERAEAGDPAMQCLYGLALLNGSAGRTHPEEAREWLRRSAEAGDDRGRFEYGKMLYSGAGGRVDQPSALEWLLPAAESGNNEAAYYVGVMLIASEELPHDPVLGEQYLRAAARAGIANAQADLGIAYYSGLGGIERDYGEAGRWFTLAAKQGNGDACNKLGVMHRNGLGVRANPELAILWFTMGAALGDPYARHNLANAFMNGEWVARDYARAAQWHAQAANAGNADSMYSLGCLYAEGIGVEKDLGRARELLTLAERNGNERAGELLETLWDLGEGDSASAPPAPVRIAAGPLLREFSVTPLSAVNRGRVVLLEVGEDVEIADAGAGSFYLTVPGSPGVIYCSGTAFSRETPIRGGMTIRGVGGGFSGLPGFLRLEDVREATAEDLAESEPAGAEAAGAEPSGE